MARRAGLWALGGATAAAGVLVASPEAYAWLRRKAGLEQPEVEREPSPNGDDGAEASFDTREARLSLRARLSEAETESATEAEVTAADERPLAARPRPSRDDVEPMRRAVDEARARMLDGARSATRENGPAA
jgi:hypothetical protein